MKNNKKNSNRILFISILLISGLLVSRDIYMIDINKYIFVAFYLILFIFLPLKHSIALLSFSIPLFSGLPGNYIVLSFLIISILKNYKILTIGREYLFILIILFIECINLYYYKTDIINVANVVLSITALTYVFTSMKNISLDYRVLSNCVIYGTVVLILIIFINTLNETTFMDILTLKSRIGVIKESNNLIKVSLNPNALGASMSFVYALLLIKIQNNRKTIFNIFLILIFLFTGFLTLSRTFFLNIVLITFLFILTQDSIKSAFKFVLSCCVVITFSIIFFPSIMEIVLDNYLFRFTSNDLTGGRDTIFKDYNILFFSNIKFLLFGVGVDNYSSKYNYILSSHNSLQELYLVWGLTGFIAIIALFTSIFYKRIKRISNGKILLLLPFFAIFFSSLAGQLFTSDRIYYILISILVLDSYMISKSHKITEAAK